MSESIGLSLFAIGGTNAGGYSLVKVFYLRCTSSSGTAYNISQASYDFGIMLSGNSHNHSAKPFCFPSSNGGSCTIYAEGDNSVIIGNLTITSTNIRLVGDDSGNYAFNGSFALFKFNSASI